MYIKEALKEIKIGADEDSDIGAMTTIDQIEKIKNQIDDTLKKGAKIIVGGSVKDSFFEPTLIAPCTNDMDLINEETFGPIIAIVKTKNDEESLNYANDSKFGLSSSIYGKSKFVKKFIDRIKSGNVVVNNSILSLVAGSLPYGGIKESWIERYHSEDGLKKTFCNIKSVLVDHFTFMEDFAWMPYGKNAYKSYLKFIKKFWGSINIFKIFYVLPLVFKKRR